MGTFVTTTDLPTLRDWLSDGAFTLTCSSGFFGFFAHAGMLSALLDDGLAPSDVTGSSAGALVTTGYAAGASPEDFRREMERLTRADFWDPFPGLGFLRGRKFREILQRVFPVTTFEETKTPVRVSVFDVTRMKTRVIGTGNLVDAVYASCAVPIMFHPIWHQGGLLVDGGVLDRPGLKGAKPGARVLYHHLPTTARWRVDHKSPLVDNGATLVMNGLPRPSPFRLHEGPFAYAAAFEAAKRALNLPFDPRAPVHVDVKPSLVGE